MFKIEYSKKFTDNVIHFTDTFHRKNIEQLLDSGIENEMVIIENYNILAKNLRNMIFQKIGNYFLQDFVAKNISQDSNILLSIITIHTLKVFVYYQEDTEKLIRYIKDIEFFRK